MKTTMKSRVQRLLIGFTFGVGLTLSARDLGAQTQIANLRTAVEETGTVQNQTTSNQTSQDQKIQQLQDKLEEIQKELIELKQASSIAPETHHTTTPKASVTSSDLSEAEPESTDPSNPHSEPFAFADFTWLTGNARTERHAVCNQVLHSGDTLGRELYVRLPPSAGRHHQRVERGLPLE